MNKHQEKTELTKLKIIGAAIEEFGLKGLDGVKIEEIAAKSGYNKALIYRHYKNKEELYREVIRYILDQREEALQHQPHTFVELVDYWVKMTHKHRDVIRILTQEAIRYDDMPIVDKNRQESYYEMQAEFLAKINFKGKIKNKKLLLLAAISLTTFPFAFPQISKMILGYDPFSVKFSKSWRQFLAEFLS